MLIKTGAFIAAVLLCLLPLTASGNTLYFPQVPYGGGYTTNFVVMNTGTSAINSTLNLYNQSGVLMFGQGINVPVGGSQRYSLTGSGTLNIVYGILPAGSGSADGVASFELRDGNHVLTTTAGILGVAAGNSFVLPVDQTATGSTGLAIANVQATTPVTVNLLLLNQDGTTSSTANDVRLSPLGPLHQIADFVTSMFPQLVGGTFQGTLIVQAASGSPANSLAVAALTVKEGMLSAISVIPYMPSTATSGTGTGGSSSSGSGSGNSNAATIDNATLSAANMAGGLLNFPCSVSGLIFNSGAFWICDTGKWRYALNKDAPAVPVGGYTSPPAWFPPLNSNPTPAPCPAGGVTFTASVLPVAQLGPSIPYGEMVADHVTPIDHGYLGLTILSTPVASRTESDYVAVTSPAAGVITSLSSLGSPTSHRVSIDHGCGILGIYQVVNRITGVLASYAAQVETQGSISLSIPVNAGDEFGRQRDNPLDFNVYDSSKWLSGLTAFSYASTAASLYTSDPTLYFTAALASVYNSDSQRTVSPRWGKLDYDVMGSAQGNWFLDGTLGYSCITETDATTATKPFGGGYVAPGKNGYPWCHLAIAPHWVQPSVTIGSFGWWKDPNGDFLQWVLKVGAGQPAPTDLTAASGTVVYQVNQITTLNPDGSPYMMPTSSASLPIGYQVGTGLVGGFVALRVNADNTLTVETLPGATSASAFTGFTVNQRLYRR